MINPFIKLKNNSLWILNNEIIIIYKTYWIYNNCIYPTVLYYKQNEFIVDNIPIIYYMTRIEFILSAKKYNENYK